MKIKPIEDYSQKKTNSHVKEIIMKLVGKYESLLANIKRRKVSYYGHVC